MLSRAFLFTALSLFAFARSDAQARSSAGDAGAAQSILNAVNHDRVHDGERPLQWDYALAAAAYQHAEFMATHNLMSHQLRGEPDLAKRAGSAGASFSMVGENIAVVAELRRVHQEWMDSPHHRENILNPSFDSIGIAFVRRGSMVFAVEDFSKSVESFRPAQVEQQLSELLAKHGIAVLEEEAAFARSVCGTERGHQGGPTPNLTLRYTVASPTQIEGDLVEKLREARYSSAAVGTCALTGNNDGFTRYRIAILLYKKSRGQGE